MGLSIDREKVIKGLEELYGFLFREYANIPAEESKIYYERTCAIRDAIAMLKEQEAVKPQLSISGIWYECPICHRHVTKDRDNYCARCGKSVKWDD